MICVPTVLIVSYYVQSDLLNSVRNCVPNILTIYRYLHSRFLDFPAQIFAVEIKEAVMTEESGADALAVGFF